MTKLRLAIDKVTAWQVRIVALSFLVILVGSSSQVLANALAAGAGSEAPTPKTTTVISKTPTVISTSTVHVKIRRAGVNSRGGYTAPGNK